MIRLLGKKELTRRFLRVSLFQGVAAEMADSHQQRLGAHAILSEDGSAMFEEDPTLFCTSLGSDRFFMFTSREPKEVNTRDVMNEKPKRIATKIMAQSSLGHRTIGKSAIIRTSYGDIHVKLFGHECPKTVENFTVHSQKGYYNNVIFHRVIKGFMIQTGDPHGDGTGGESIWGGEFEDEFDRNLKHDRPGTLSMANAGPNTNGSQFFITTAEASWLDNKHTVFGRVQKGMDVVGAIESVRVDKRHNKPKDPIRILNIDILK